MNKGLLAVLVIVLIAAMIPEPSEALLRAGRRNSIWDSDSEEAQDLYERLVAARAAGVAKRAKVAKPYDD